ncbi:peptidoglycan-binding protein [Kitasatospora aureofaciens]|uniref:peptidoglycan-binding domain-containing protein n=1 Tax=Kitasatospora aureofaciens TaxID=1894 RepID=UPI001C46D35A|nr:peptidoglycan-binding domain-containing protein [Kitasatospora aureofaciens]MBV6698099.1 peptidoglycan-binding protein [Kitasatospora aureofaciens]
MRKTWALRAATLTLGAGAVLGLAVGSAGAATAATTLQLGDSGPAVTCVQQALNLEIGSGLAEDGVYGQSTADAVAKFQPMTNVMITNSQLPATGVVDATTGSKLYKSVWLDFMWVNPGDNAARKAWLTGSCPTLIPR